MMDFNDDDFEFFKYDMNDYEKENFDFPISHSTPSVSRSKQQTIRPIDYPSINKHYGMVTFFDYQLPIIYRLINDNLYIPYIRFSYVLHIFEHSSYKKYLVNIRNLPIIEMTSIESIYYNQLSSLDNNSDWSNSQLLSISMLDGILTIINYSKDFNFKNDSSSIEWEKAMNIIREETRNRWILNENLVLIRLKEKTDINSTCISSTTISKRRSFFEQRLDLSIVNEAGGFIQINSYIYPFIKNLLDDQIYINLDDIRQNFVRPLSDLICYNNPNSSMSRTYNIVIQQAQSNYECARIRYNHMNDLLKILPTGKEMNRYFNDELPFISLQNLLNLFLKKNSNLNLQFIQLFEISSLDEIELNYKNNISRQFIMTIKQQGGLINNKIPCLINLDNIWIPSEIKTQRIMTNDERLYLNIILLYYGLWKYILTKKKQWYLKEINKENIHLEILK